MTVRDRDQTILLEIGQRAADRFDGQAQIIGDVLTAHRQIEGDTVFGVVAFGEQKQEGGHALLRRLTAQHHQMILGGGEFAAQQKHQLAAHIDRLIGEPFDLAARAAHQHADDPDGEQDRREGEGGSEQHQSFRFASTTAPTAAARSGGGAAGPGRAEGGAPGVLERGGWGGVLVSDDD